MASQTTTIQKEWRKLPIKDLVDLVVDNRGRNPDRYVAKGIPVIDNVLIKGERKIELDEARRFIDDDTYSTFIRKYNQENDVLITLVGNGYGNVALSPKEKSIIMQNTIGLRCNDLGDNVFLFYNLSLNKRSLTDLNIGAAQPSIKVGDLLSIELTIPPIAEQRAIASVLSSLDDKIELLREENKTLEATAQAIFKEWFVNFNFPDATGKMIDSELGEIPEGWKIGKIKDEIKTILGGTPSRANNSFWDAGSIPWINSGAINNFPIMRASEYITKEGLKNSAAKLMPAKTVVLPFVITPGSEIKISFLGIESSGNQSVLGLLETEKFSCGYIYFWIQQMKNKLYSGATGGAQQHINKQEVENLELLIPTHKVLESFNTLSYPIIEKIIENSFQIQTLSTLRDTLLPKLMKGEVRVKGFEN